MARTPNTVCDICKKPLYRRPYELAKVKYVCCRGCRSTLYKRHGHGKEQLAKGRGWNKGKSKAAGDDLTYGRPRSEGTKQKIKEGVLAAFVDRPRKLVSRLCKECGTAFETYASNVNRGNGRFCSRSCTSRFTNKGRDYLTGSGNPNWKGGPIVFTCAECGEESSRRRGGPKPKFCSRKCKGSAQSRRMINDPYVVKTYDTDIERILESWLQENGFEYEKQRTILDVCTPDFFIEPRTCLFADGDYWHKKPKTVAQDRWVNKRLKERGYHVVRLWGSEIHAGVRPHELLCEKG